MSGISVIHKANLKLPYIYILFTVLSEQYNYLAQTFSTLFFYCVCVCALSIFYVCMCRCIYVCAYVSSYTHTYTSCSRLAYATSRPCSYYDRGIKVQTRVGQNRLMFELLPDHGSFFMPTITLNILAYSNLSAIHTHLTTFNTIPLMSTIIIFLFSFFLTLLLSYVLRSTYPIFFNMPSRPPRMAPSPRHSGVQRISGQIPGSTAQVRVGTRSNSNGPTHDPTPQDRLSSFSIHYTNICGINSNFSSVEPHLATSSPNLFLLSETQLSRQSSPDPFQISRYNLYSRFCSKGGVAA